MIRIALLIIERWLDRAMRAVERAHEWNEGRMTKRAVEDLKATIDELGRDLSARLGPDQVRVTCRVLSLPRHSSKVH